MSRLSYRAIDPPLPDDTTIDPDDFDVWLGLHRSANNSLTSETRHQSTVVIRAICDIPAYASGQDGGRLNGVP
jgi:hypothetical protein